MNTKFCFLLILLFSTFFSAFPQPMEVSQKLVRRNGVLYLIENNDSFAVSNSIITVKPKRVNDNLDNNLIVLRSNTLGFIDVKVPIDAEVEGYVESLRKTI